TRLRRRDLHADRTVLSRCGVDPRPRPVRRMAGRRRRRTAARAHAPDAGRRRRRADRDPPPRARPDVPARPLRPRALTRARALEPAVAPTVRGDPAPSGLSSVAVSDHALGLDFGTNSVRALLVRCDAGEHVASAERGYANGVDGVVLDPRDPHLARQVPSDWIDALIGAVREVLATARERGVGADAIAGIGVDTTASTPLPVDAGGAALAEDPRFRSEPAALAWLWKDHTAH